MTAENEQQTPERHVSPVTIRRDSDDAVVIEWSDRKLTRWSAAELRRLCPCATCREKRRAEGTRAAVKPTILPVLSAAEAQPLRIEAMRPVGTYAYNVAFSDGHSSGLYTFAMLRGATPPEDYVEAMEK